MKQKFFNDCDGWCKSYSSVMVVGATVGEIEAAAKQIYEASVDDVCYNGVLHKDGSITFDVYRENPRRLAIMFSARMPKAVVYAETSWDYHEFVAYKNGAKFTGYTAKWLEKEPEPYEECDGTYYDCDVVVMDNRTRCTFNVGGGMCTEKEFDYYCKLIRDSQWKIWHTWYFPDGTIQGSGVSFQTYTTKYGAKKAAKKLFGNKENVSFVISKTNPSAN